MVLLVIDPKRLTSPLEYESPVGQHPTEVGQLFPHVYGPLNIDAVYDVISMPPNSDGFFALSPGLITEKD